MSSGMCEEMDEFWNTKRKQGRREGLKNRKRRESMEARKEGMQKGRKEGKRKIRREKSRNTNH